MATAVSVEEELDLSALLSLETTEREATRKIVQLCRIDLSALRVALERQPALFAYSVACYEMAKVREAQAKWNVEVCTAQAVSTILDQNKASDKKLTDLDKNAKIKMMPLVKNAVEAHHNAMIICSRLRGLVDGLGHRRDMLVQIAAKQRQEDYG